jgi:chromosome segregation ATPase
MRNILMILVVVAIAMTSCNNDKQNLSNSFDNLQKESDSLLQVHTALKNHHNMHMDAYASVNERLAGVALQDSSVLETLASQQVVLKSHEADIQKAEQLFAGHSELKANFSNLTPEEMQAQIDAMTADLEEIKNAQSTLSAEHEELSNEIAQIEETFKKQELTAEVKQ